MTTRYSILTICFIVLLINGGVASGQDDRYRDNPEEEAIEIELISFTEDFVGEEDPVDVYIFHIPEGVGTAGVVAFGSPFPGTIVSIHNPEADYWLIEETMTHEDEHEIIREIHENLPPGPYFVHVGFAEGREQEMRHYFLELHIELIEGEPRFEIIEGEEYVIIEEDIHVGEFEVIEGHERLEMIDPDARLDQIPPGQLEYVGQKVSLQMPSAPMFVGSYAKVPVTIHPSSGLMLSDLNFVIPSGPKGGEVSRSKDEHFDWNNPDIMLLAGYEPGNYRLQVKEISTGTVLTEGQFSVTDLWKDDKNGPPLWVSGEFEMPGIPGAAWGGGSSTDPENYNIIPHTGTNRMAILFVDTKTHRFTQNEIQAFKDNWEDAAYQGFTYNGDTVSTAHYYRESSHQSFGFTGQVFGPVQLPGDWSDYYETNGKYKGGLWQACVTAGDSLIDYKQFDHIICVARPIPAAGAVEKLSVWPHADSMVAKTAEGDIPLGTVTMPVDGALFDITATLAHELGHNIGLGDIYPWGGHLPNIQGLTPGSWALMAYQSGLPHPVFVHRLKLGWIPKKNIKLYNFQAIGGFVDDTVKLSAVEIASPPSGNYSGIEIRIAPGWNYYFEYRSAQTGQIGDQNLPTNMRVLGTDVMFEDGFENPSRRKPVMLLRNDSDGDGPVLGVNQDYEEQDISTPNFPTNFKIEVTRSDAISADVHIQYGVNDQPDPSIRPWNPPVYQSADIEVRNARTQADPKKYWNTPWENHWNTVVAKVTNRGKMNAPNVKVDFYIKDLTTNASSSAPIYLGSDTQNVDAQKTVEFSTQWAPKAAGHYCIEARIKLYQTPGPNSVIEVTEYNNRAQSNYDQFISAKSSPASREIAKVKVENPFDQPARVHIHVAKTTNPLYRTYIPNTWLVLGAKETRYVEVMFEYAADDKMMYVPQLETFINKPNQVSVYATVEEPSSNLEQAAVQLGGFTAMIVTGRATRFDQFAKREDQAVYGKIIALDDGTPVSGGSLILTINAGEDQRETGKSMIVGVGQQGDFYAQINQEWISIDAYYMAPSGYTDCQSVEIFREGGRGMEMRGEIQIIEPEERVRGREQ